MLAGASTGIDAEMNAWSHWFAIDDETAPGSSPETASTPPSAAVPAALACLSASPARSTPGFFAYHRPNTPSTRAPPPPPPPCPGGSPPPPRGGTCRRGRPCALHQPRQPQRKRRKDDDQHHQADRAQDVGYRGARPPTQPGALGG